VEQVDSVQDRLAIQELNQRYATHVDLHEVDAWASLFTEDVQFDEREFGTPPMHGRDDVRAYGHHLADIVEHALHHMTTHVIEDLTATSARGVAFAVVEALLKDGSHVRSHVVYHDRYEKVDGQWLIAERVLRRTLPDEVLAAPRQG
jgi:ketosteroid isomerase-like protein